MRMRAARLRSPQAALWVAAAVLAMWAPTLRADVEPTPAWRVLGTVVAAAPKDGLVYVGGEFTQLARPSAVQDQIHDQVTGLVRPGCAISTRADRGFTGVPDEQGGLIVRVSVGDAFADGGGAFVPPAGTTFVKVRTDCTFDRIFAAPAVDPNNPTDLSAGRPVQSGAFVFASKTYYDPGTLAQVAILAQYDANSGARITYRNYGNQADPISDIRLYGRAPSGQLVAAIRRTSFFDTGTYYLATIDPSTLNVSVSSTVLQFETQDVSQSFWVRGATLYRSRPAGAGYALEAYDLATVGPKSGWTTPIVSFVGDLEVVGSRVFITSGTRLDGGAPVPLPAPAALTVATGAVDGTWTPPTLRRLVEEPSNPYTPTLTYLATDGQRLYLAGDFELAGGQERDGVAAIDATSGVLDTAWTAAPYQAVPFEFTAGGLLMSRPTGEGKVTRRYLAAVDRATGNVLPWDPNDPAVVPFFPVAPVTALAADAEWVYYATDVTGQILRARRDTADVDRVWNLTVRTAAGAAGRITTLVLDGGVLYAGGQFAAVQGHAFALTARQDIFSLDVGSGVLRQWAPSFQGPSDRELIRSIVPLGGIVYVGGEFSVVNGVPTDVFVGLDPNNGFSVTQPLFVQADTRLTEMATDGVSIYVAGTTLGGPLVGVIPAPASPALVPYTVPSGLVPLGVAYLAGRLYAGREFDPATGTVTASPVTWPKVIAAADGLLAVRDDNTGLEFYPVLQGDPPPAPTNLQVQVSGNLVGFAWSAGEPAEGTGVATSYVLRVGSASGLGDLAAFDTRSLDTTFTTPGPDGRYFVRVHARNQFGESAPSNEVVVQIGAPPCTVAPAPVASLTHTVAGLAAAFAWSPADGATSYQLEAGSAPGLANLAVVNVGNATRFAATAGAGTYYVRVRGVNACGLGPASNEAVVVLGGPVLLPGAPTDLRVTVDPFRNVSISWTPPASGGTPSLYQLEAGYTPGASNAAVATTGATGLFAPGVPPATYYVRVRAINAAGAGEATPDVAVTVP